MSKMTAEEEESVQAEFAQLEREARGEVSLHATSLHIRISRSLRLSPWQTVADVEQRQKIEERLPAVPSTLPPPIEVDTDEVYEADRVKQIQNQQREEDLRGIAMPS